jgi:hypothetical protein
VNADPHTHELQIYDYNTSWGFWQSCNPFQNGSWSIVYGDQTKRIDKPMRGLLESQTRFAARCERRLRDVITSIIKHHDRESIKAGERVDVTKRIRAEFQAKLTEKVEPKPKTFDDFGFGFSWNRVPRTRNLWGTDALFEPETQEPEKEAVSAR